MSFKEVKAEAFGFTLVFINSFLIVQHSLTVQPRVVGIACMLLPAVSVAAVRSRLQHPIPVNSPSLAGAAGSSSSAQERLLSPLSRKQGT